MTQEQQVSIPKKSIGILVVIVIAGFLLMSAFYSVREDQQVVVTRLGKPVRIVKKAGLNYRMPFIEEVHIFSKKLLEYDSSPTEIITQDKKDSEGGQLLALANLRSALVPPDGGQ